MSDLPYVIGLKKPDEKMLDAARDWSAKKYGKPIGNDAAEGCWNAMLSASACPVSLDEIVGVLENLLRYQGIGIMGQVHAEHREKALSLLQRLKAQTPDHKGVGNG